MNSFKLLFSIWAYLNQQRKIGIIISLVLSMISSFSEILSLATVIPLLSIITNPENYLRNSFFSKISKLTGIYEYNNLLLLIAFLFISASLFCALIRFTNLKYSYNLSAKIGTDLASKAFYNILHQPYEFHLELNSSSVISSLTTQLNLTVQSINQLLLFITSLLITISILISLFFINIKISSFLFSTISISYLIISILYRKKIQRNTQKISKSSRGQVKFLQEGLGGIKEIILYSNQDFFIKKFRNEDQILRKHISSNVIISVFPRYFLEAFAFTAIASIALFLTLKDNNSIIPILGTFALGAQRLLPSIQQLYYAFTTVRGTHSAVADVMKWLNTKNITFFPNNKIKQFNFKKNIYLKDIKFKYSNSKKYTLENININIKAGEKVGIIGTTGSGKSTLVDIILGLIPPSSGEMIVDDINIFEKNNQILLSAWKNSIAYVPQRMYLIDGTILENIALGEDHRKIDRNHIERCCKIAQINEFIQNKTHGIDTVVGERGIKISGGQAQRICIARSLYRKSKVLIFDEATSALDNKTEDKLIGEIEKNFQNQTIIIIAHRLSTIKSCNKVIEIRNGKISRSGNPDLFIKNNF